MARESEDATSGDTPPSFIPTHHANPSSQPSSHASGGSSEDLPSFAPRRSSNRGSHPSVSTGRPYGSMPRSSGSRYSQRKPNASQNAPSSRRQYQSSSSNIRRPQAQSFSARPSRQGGKGGTTRLKFNFRRIIAVIIIVILLLLAIFGIGMWNWVNGQLSKKDMLTSAADSSAQTWLILGSDQRDGTPGTGTEADAPGFRTDTLLVLTKPKSGSSSLISIPRDSLVQLNGTYMKINAVAESGGYSALTGQVENITGEKIDHVAMIKFGGLEKVVNALGGVELCYSSTVNDANSGLNWTAGCHVANGTTALAFSRMRYSDPEGDFGRAKRQRQAIAAIVKKASSSTITSSPSTMQKVAKASLASIVVDNKTNPYTLLKMALAFKAASGTSGVTGSVYWSNPDYYPGGNVGSTVLLDASKNKALFTSLGNGTHAKGTVGGQV
ncbi:MAG: LCP family protein [Bifidobacterium aquikefiri]|uniref:Transcriptional regulator n=1 Tax=Bifidobacterium aquikefiri TaxID=1653207 RepID=A0A261G609_9BIFI|nr:LCP family protein [Bifidobacterium aquikefiri]OZG66850.1 transcriptional regulator [Bifidobacterium aquikefiri]